MIDALLITDLKGHYRIGLRDLLGANLLKFLARK
jgi:hypothetical protein